MWKVKTIRTMKKVYKQAFDEEVQELQVLANYYFLLSEKFFNELNFDDKIFENLEEEKKWFDKINLLNELNKEKFVKMCMAYNHLITKWQEVK